MNKLSHEAAKVDTMQYQETSQKQLDDARTRLQQLENPQLDNAPSVQNTLEPLNDLQMVLNTGLNQAALYRNVHPNADIRRLAGDFEAAFAKVATDISLSQPIFAAIQNMPIDNADAATKRQVAHLLRDMRRLGVDKDEPTRKHISRLTDELVHLGQAFDENIREDVRHITLTHPDDLAGLPQDYRQSHPADAQGLRQISTDYPDYLPFMTYAHNDDARKQLYTAFRQRGYPKNQTVLEEILKKRYELAQLLGYPQWAAYITADKMIQTDQAVSRFIEKIDGLARPRGKAEYAQLLDEARRINPQAQQVNDWQKAYLEERLKQRSYQFDAQAVRQFFPFKQVLQGLLDITSQMFGITYKKLDLKLWHPSVQAFEILEAGQSLGIFYLDLHPRPNKYKHAAAFPLVSGVTKRVLPQAALVCNFPEGDDALLEHDAVQTFFHEFGHLLHHMFAKDARWVNQSGIATEWDFVEAPSQMFEEWTFDAATLKSFAKNTRGEVIGDLLIANMQKSRDFGKGLWVMQQMFYASLSLQLHNENPSLFDIQKRTTDLQAQYTLFPYVPNTYFQLSFGHLEGYSAMYYTYMWSLVIAKDLFGVFYEQGLLNSLVAKRYRQSILQPGGTQDANILIQNFLGRPLSFDAFASWLNAT